MFESIRAYIVSNIDTVVEIAIGVVGFIGVILSLGAERRVKITEFIANYNLTFLTTERFVEMERKLEGGLDAYYKCCKAGDWGEAEVQDFYNACDRTFGTSQLLFQNGDFNRKYDDSGAITEEYQSVVNYLVYLESFSTLITQKRARIKDVDDLFGYRFFIAVNNPVLQENELIPYSRYYCGIRKAYDKWVRYYKRHNIEEPMKEFAYSKRIKANAKNGNTGKTV